MKRLNAGSESPDFLDHYRKFCVRTWELWRLGKESKGQRGIVPIRPFPALHVKDFLKFVLIDGASGKLFDCGHIRINHARAAEAHVIFFFILYTSRFGNTSTGGGQDGEMCKEIKPTETCIDPSTQKAKTIPSDSKNIQSPPPHKIAKREKVDYFDPLAGIVY